MSKPKFNPNQPYEVVQDSKPKFDPNLPFESVDEPSLLQTAAGKLASGGTQGFIDELAGGLEAGGTALGIKGLGGKLKDIGLSDEGPTLDYDTLSSAYQKARNAERGNQSDMSKARPILSGALELAGGLATAPIGGAATLAGRVGTAAGMGAVTGLGTSNEDSIAGLAKDTAIGGALGGALQYGGEKIIAPAAKKVGQYFTESKPAKALGKVLASVDGDTTERYLNRSKQINAASELEDVGMYFKDDVIPKLQEHVGNLDTEAWKALSTKPNMAKEDILQLGQDYVQKLLGGKTGNLTRTAGTGADADKIKVIYDQLEEVQKAFGSHISESDLKSVVQNLQKLGWSLEGSPRTSIQGQALQELSGVYNDILKKGNSTYAQKMKPVAEAMDTMQSLKRHFTNQQAPEELNRFLGTAKKFGMPSENSSAVSAVQKADKMTGLDLENRIRDSVAKSAFEKSDTNGSRKTIGAAIMGKAIEGSIGGALGYTASDGSAAGAATGAMIGMSLDKYAGQVFKKILNGQLAAGQGWDKIAPHIGKYAKPLMDAASRGNKAVSATHFILQQTQPEYREMIKKMEEGN